MIYLTIEDKKGALLELAEEVAWRVCEQRREIEWLKNTRLSEEFVNQVINYFQDCNKTNFNKKVSKLQNFKNALGESYPFLQARVEKFAKDTKGPKKKVRFVEDTIACFFKS